MVVIDTNIYNQKSANKSKKWQLKWVSRVDGVLENMAHT